MARQTSLDLANSNPEVKDNSLQGIDNDLSNLQTNTEVWNLNQEIMKAQIADLLQKYTSLRNGIKSTEWNRATKKQLESWLDQNIKNLNDMQNDLNNHNYSNLNTYNNRICELIYYFDHYEQVRQIITLWWKTWNIHMVIDSKQDARRSRRQQRSNAADQQNMNTILHDAALTSLRNNDMENYEEYLKAVANWQIEPSSHPFYKSHAQSFKLISCTNPSLYRMLVPSWTSATQYVVPTTWVIDASTFASGARRASRQSESFTTKVGRWVWEIAESLIPSVERDPRQKRAWEQAGSLLALWWAIYMWAKLIKNVFSSKKSNPDKREKAAGRWVWLLALTNSDKLFNWVQDITGWHPSEKIQVSTELFQRYWFSDTDALRYSEMHIWAPVAVMSALHFIPIQELSTQNIVEYKNNEFQFNYDNYERYVKNYKRTDEQKRIVLTAWQKLRDDNSINIWFAWLNINDWNQLNSLAQGSKTRTLADCPEIQNAWSENAELIASKVHTELYKQWLKAKSPEAANQIVNEYNQNWWKDIKKPDLNNLVIKWMQEWLLEVNGDVKYDLDDMINDPDVNLQNKTMEWFNNSWWTPIKFESYKDLFDTVQLTKWIKYNFKWRPAETEKPFHIDAMTWRIEFDDTDWYKVWKNETDVLKARTLNKTSSTLWWNRQFYVDYLNNRRISWGKDWIWEEVESLISPVHTELRNQWLKVKNSQSARQIIDEYNQKWWKNITKADLHNLIVRWLKAWWLKMNNPDKKYDIEDMISNPNIDLANKSINWFENDWWTPIKFESYEELFDIMYLTRWIKYNFKWRPAKTDDPFHIEVQTWRVEFDNQPFRKIRKGDLDVLRARTLTQTSSTLKGNKQFYVDYLNDWRISWGKDWFM